MAAAAVIDCDAAGSWQRQSAVNSDRSTYTRHMHFEQHRFNMLDAFGWQPTCAALNMRPLRIRPLCTAAQLPLCQQCMLYLFSEHFVDETFQAGSYLVQQADLAVPRMAAKGARSRSQASSSNACQRAVQCEGCCHTDLDDKSCPERHTVICD